MAIYSKRWLGKCGKPASRGPTSRSESGGRTSGRYTMVPNVITRQVVVSLDVIFELSDKLL